MPYIFLAILVVVLVAFGISKKMKKQKYEKYKSEHLQEQKDCRMIFDYRGAKCPLCENAYTVWTEKRTEEISPARFIDGTYYARETTTENDTYYTCAQCHYRLYYFSSRGNTVFKYDFIDFRKTNGRACPANSWRYDDSFNLKFPKEQRERIENALDYDRTVKKMEEELK